MFVRSPFSHGMRRRSFLCGVASTAVMPIRRAIAGEDTRRESTERFNAWLESRFDGWIARSPMQQGYLGLRINLDRWDDISQSRYAEDLERARKELVDLRENFSPSSLTPNAQLSYQLYEFELEQRIVGSEWRYHEYPVHQMFGWQQVIPSYLINIHAIASKDDAFAYISRIRKIGVLIDQVIAWMRVGQEADVLPPKFVYNAVVRDCRNVLSGEPFGGEGRSPLWRDFTGKVNRLNIDANSRDRLLAEAKDALVHVVKPAFLDLIAASNEQQEMATTDDGIWKLPSGEEYYAHLLTRHTTTSMSANEIHDFGIEEVARIHSEMRDLMKKAGIQEGLKSFFSRLKTDPAFYYPQSEDGRSEYLARTREIINAMRSRLGEMFETQPNAPLVVKAVEPFREQSAEIAFYQGPGTYDGRPGTYYINTYDMRALPKYEMEALAYHETLPGHHFQIAMVQEMDALPRFRRFSGRYTAYMEGWSLYSEYLAKEMGFYQDPISDFGRLTSELWRASRLVVDTGIHSPNRKWTRQRSIEYLSENTPNAHRDIVNSVERYIVQPAQATAYKIGMASIQNLRREAEDVLGEKFDVRAFHNVILGSGALPLNILAENVRGWAVRERGS